jgi:hypothetical protein
MSIALSCVTVANSIAALSISGVTVKDIDEVPVSGNLILPVVFPQPNNWISDIQPVTKSLGSLGTEKMDFSYTLHYVFLHSLQGSGISQTDHLSPLITKLELVLEAILNNDVVTGLVDMQLSSLNVGTVEDPSGKPYWGALFTLRCLEYAQ